MAEVETIPASPPFYRTNPRNLLSESPIYRISDHTLHWIDIVSRPTVLHILPLDPTTHLPLNPSREIKLPTSLPVSCIRFRQGRKEYICAFDKGIGYLDEETGEVRVVKRVIGEGADGEEWGMNDGGVDPQGRFWVGEVDLRALGAVVSGKGGRVVGRGKLWCFDGREVREWDRGVICGNGMGWSPDGRFMYHNDSGKQILWRYDFDGATGKISNKIPLIGGLDGKGKEVLNDGMVVDQEGNLWIAMWMDYAVQVYSPEGQLTKRIEFPAKCITCPAWGGEKNNILFLTSGQPIGEKLPEGDEGGYVFKYEPGVKGMGTYEFAG